ncbi:hypothetical protein [Azospirillum melinis]
MRSWRHLRSGSACPPVNRRRAGWLRNPFFLLGRRLGCRGRRGRRSFDRLSCHMKMNG